MDHAWMQRKRSDLAVGSMCDVDGVAFGCEFGSVQVFGLRAAFEGLETRLSFECA